MTDLDRKIAELKGWRPEKPFDQIRELDEVYWLDQNGKRTEFAVVGFYHCDGAEGWDHGYHIPEFSPSCNTSQAFELVDELTGADTNVVFQLSQGQVTRQWQASFICLAPRHRVNGEASTRPEAICRAYIALKEWEAKKNHD